MPLQDISHVFALSGNYVQARIRFVENYTNINGNYSNVTIYIDVHRTNTGYTTSGSGSLSGWINDANGGRVINFSHSFSASVSNSNWLTLYSTTVNISHNSTGKGNCSVSVSIDWQRDGSSSANFTMTTIPRAATISGVVDFNDEDNPGFTFSNPGNFNMECWLEPNPNGDHLAIRTVTKATSGTFTWDLTDEERAQLRQKCAGKTCTIRVGLYSNNKSFNSYKDVTYSIINANPILGDNSWQTTNHLDLVETNTVIKNKSNIDVVVSEATPQKEATIKQYKVVIGSQIKTSESPTTFTFENIDTSIINVYVEDSRGFVSSELLNISNFIDYVEPDILSVSAERNDGGIGSSVVLGYKGTMWSGNFGKKENTITVQYFYKKNGDSTWVQGLTDITPESIFSSFENSEEILGDLGALGFEQASVYDLKIIITDLLGSYEETKIGCIPSGTPEMAFAKKGVAFGAFYDDGEGGPVQIEGLNIINLLYPIGSQIYNAKDDFDPNIYYPGTTWIKKYKTRSYMITGTKVLASSSNSVVVHTIEEVEELFNSKYGIESIDKNNLGISYWNGDGAATVVHIEGATYQNSNIYAVFDRTVSGSVRVNFAYMYNKTEYYWERTA